MSESEGSGSHSVQTGEEEEKEEADLEKNTVLGLSEMILNEHNKCRLAKLEKSSMFKPAAQFLYQQIGEELNQHLKASTADNVEAYTEDDFKRAVQKVPGVLQYSQNNQLFVYLEEPSVLNRLSKIVKLMEIGEKSSIAGYQLRLTGDKKGSNGGEFSTFGNTVVYNQKSGYREKIKENIKNINKQPVYFENALSSEDQRTF